MLGMSSRTCGSSQAVPLAMACSTAALTMALALWRRSRLQDGKPACQADWLRAGPGSLPRVTLVATGSVASVKVPEMAVALCEFSEVVVVLTGPGSVMAGPVAAAYSSAHIADWEALKSSRRLRVLGDLDEWQGYRSVADTVVHVELGKWADAIVIAPCSANGLMCILLALSQPPADDHRTHAGWSWPSEVCWADNRAHARRRVDTHSPPAAPDSLRPAGSDSGSARTDVGDGGRKLARCRSVIISVVGLAQRRLGSS